TGDGSLALMVFLVVSLCAGLPIAIVVVANRLEARRNHRLRAYGRTSSGSVTELGAIAGDGMTSSTYWADVSCHDDDQEFTARVPLTGAQYKALYPGSRLDVTYLPGRPRTARVL